MKKKIFLLFVLIFMTGCNAVYNIEITDDKVLESSDFYATKKIFYDPSSDGVSENDEISDYYYKQDYPAFKNGIYKKKLYNKKMIDNNDLYGMNLNYSFGLNNYNDSSLLNYCFDSSVFKVKDNYIILDAKDVSKCFTQDIYEHLDFLTVKVKTDLNVTENNADEVDNNIYIWEISREDSLNKDIYLKIKKSVIKKNFPFITVVIIIGVIIAVIGLVITFIRKKNIENNAI